MLIKLTGLPHPDLNGGKGHAVYLDPSRIICITRSTQQQVKLLHNDLKREVYDDLYSGMRRFNDLLNKKMPTEIDNADTAKWAKDMHALSHGIHESYQMWSRAFQANDYYPRVDCTEIQLACGTALEHGVMLARIWVTDTPEAVAELLNPTDRAGALRGLP